MRIKKNPHLDPFNICLMHVNDWDEIKHDYHLYHDQRRFLGLRKSIVLVYTSLSLLFRKILQTKYFMLFMMFTVFLNLTAYSFQNYEDNYA